MPGLFQITLKVFLVKDDHLLVLRDAKSGQGDLPGGRLDAGEIYQPYSESIEREIREELGANLQYQLKQEEPLFIFPHYIEESGYEALGLAFQAKYITGTVQLSAEHNHKQWVALQQLRPAELFSAHMQDAVQRFLKEYALS